MAIMAKWGEKVWEVSSQRITALDSISASVELDTENSDDKAGSPATKTKALKLQTMNFDFDLASVAGCDVRSEYESWTALIGKYAPFFLADQRFGPANLQLTGVSLSDTVLNDFGRILKGRISVSFTEYSQEASGKKASSTTKTSSGSSASVASKRTSTATRKQSGGIGSRMSALDIGATIADKATKKTGIALLDAATKLASAAVLASPAVRDTAKGGKGNK